VQFFRHEDELKHIVVGAHGGPSGHHSERATIAGSPTERQILFRRGIDSAEGPRSVQAGVGVFRPLVGKKCHLKIESEKHHVPLRSWIASCRNS
jgi:hypothetical protein